jgi:thiopeptide-type bacteriocin biosynthesis protein
MSDDDDVLEPEAYASAATTARWLQVDCSLFEQAVGGPPHVPWIELRAATRRWREEGRFERFELLRKPPGLRLRFCGPQIHVSLGPALCDWLDALTSGTGLRGARPTTYEPEVHRFGGPAGMQVQHALADHDSRLVVELEAGVQAGDEAAPAHGEMTIAILSDLVRGGVDDAAEAWDVWMRLGDALGPADSDPELTGAAQWLPDWYERLPDSRRALLAAWQQANAEATAALRGASAIGGLAIGRRAWLASACVFHANRAGLTVGVMRTVVATLCELWRPPEHRERLRSGPGVDSSTT